jgi:hypothetical protein
VTARIIKFPRRGRGPIRVERAEGSWTVIYGNQGWPHPSREAALREAIELADQVNAAIIVRPHDCGERSPC